jgi:hypothetical protein
MAKVLLLVKRKETSLCTHVKSIHLDSAIQSHALVDARYIGRDGLAIFLTLPYQLKTSPSRLTLTRIYFAVFPPI